MNLKLFDYTIPKSLIAQKPLKSRDHAGLMVLDRKEKTISHHKFFKLPEFLKPGDVLVLNNTKVFPSRLWGKKQTGGKIEVFLLQTYNAEPSSAVKEPRDLSHNAEPRSAVKTWQVLLGGKGRKESLIIQFKQGLQCEIIKKNQDRTWFAKFNCSNKKLMEIVNKIGEAPIPPYIKHKSNLKKYQTIYAKHTGSVAAPTAGFHFTKKLLNELKKMGVQIEYVTLHVGLGTFEPVRTEKIEEHKMHAEYAILKKSTAQRLNKAKKENRRIIAVGTTTVRVLEAFSAQHNGQLSTVNCQRSINTFIHPGYQFKFVDAMITNFHLPKSTLLMLVSAFARSHPLGSSEASPPRDGIRFIKKAYQSAIRKKYRFYSFGDAMLIL